MAWICSSWLKYVSKSPMFFFFFLTDSYCSLSPLKACCFFSFRI